MNKFSKFAYCLAFAILIIWNLWSLVYSPIAWFDEVYFASATHSLISGNGLSVELDHYQPLVIYGPVYFLFTGAVTKLFGFGIFQFRIVNLLFAFLSVILLGKILNKLGVSKGMNLFIQILLLTDALFISNSHSGRMEFVALSFVLAAYYCFLNQFNSATMKAMLISLLLTLATLTTLRVVVICVPIAIAQLIELFKARSWSGLVVYFLIPIFLYGVWIYVAFGSIAGMISYFTQLPPDGFVQKSLFERFARGNWIILKFHYPMIFTAVLSIFYLLKNGKIKDIIVYIAPIIIYYFIVTDTGMYGVLILPFYMIIIALGLTELASASHKVYSFSYNMLLLLCLVLNCSIFVVKAFSVIMTKERRNPMQATMLIKDNIPYGSKVAGDYPYYYAAIDNGCQFKRIFREGAKVESVFDDVISNFRPDYIVLRNNSYDKKMQSLLKKSGFEKIKCYKFEDDGKVFFGQLLDKFNYRITATYEGDIYKKREQ